MNLRLVSLQAAGHDRCVAELESERTGRVRATFTVVRDDGITTASSSTDVFRDFDGTAEEQRRIIAAISTFCDVAAAGVLDA